MVVKAAFRGNTGSRDVGVGRPGMGATGYRADPRFGYQPRARHSPVWGFSVATVVSLAP